MITDILHVSLLFSYILSALSYPILRDSFLRICNNKNVVPISHELLTRPQRNGIM